MCLHMPEVSDEVEVGQELVEPKIELRGEAKRARLRRRGVGRGMRNESRVIDRLSSQMTGRIKSDNRQVSITLSCFHAV